MDRRLSGGGELTDFRVSGGPASLSSRALPPRYTRAIRLPRARRLHAGRGERFLRHPDLYLTQNPDVLEKLCSETVGTDALGLSSKIELSACLRHSDCGTARHPAQRGPLHGGYLSLPDGHERPARSEKSPFTNPKLPCAPESAVLSYAGNGALAHSHRPLWSQITTAIWWSF